ncbi:MAG: DUF4399 domain-containing protein [Vicingaceae bacterium]
MKKRILQLSLLSGLAFMVACGQAPKKEESKTEEKAEMKDEHADHDHDKMMEEQKDEKSDLLPVPDSAKVFFAEVNAVTDIDPETGEEMEGYALKFGVEGMEVEPAGELHEGKGHHHIVIDGSAIEAGKVVPADSVNIHYGKGQTETTIYLPHNEAHTLTMQFADGYHRSYGEKLSATVEVGKAE